MLRMSAVCKKPTSNQLELKNPSHQLTNQLIAKSTVHVTCMMRAALQQIITGERVATLPSIHGGTSVEKAVSDHHSHAGCHTMAERGHT